MESGLSVLICGKKNSKRFPGKSYADYKGKLLFEHTFDFADKFKLKTYLFTDDRKLESIGKDRGYNIIKDPGNWGPDPKMDMMQYIHSKANERVYMMLPITSPNRDFAKTKKYLWDFLDSNFISGTTIKRSNRNIYCLSGAVWFFRPQQFDRPDVVDKDTKFYYMDTIDVDTMEDLVDEN